VVLRKGGDDTGARAEFERALQLDPKLAGAHVRLAVLLSDTGHGEESLVYFQSNAELSKDPHEYVGWAESCLRLGKIGPGLEVFERALKVWPDNAELHHGYGNALRMAKRLDEAADHLRRACDLDPRSIGAWYTLGVILQTSRDPACMEAYAKVLELKPDHPQAMDAMGRELMQQEHFAEAVEVLQKAVACKPDYARAHSALGVALLRAGRTAEAAGPLQRAEQLDQATISYHRRTCRQFAKNPELREAVIVLCRVDLQRDPGAAESHALLVDALRGRGDYLGATEELRRWAKVRDGDAAAHQALAVCLLDKDLPGILRDPQAALAAAKRAVELAGGDVQNGLLLADALFASGDAEAALRQLDAVADKATAGGLGERLAEQRRRFGAR
jgi:tetratricopeptide (TPR) repeat protein